MQLTLSTKGQLVLPAPMRRRLRLRARSKVEVEEREGGIFIRPTRTARSLEPIDFAPSGTLKFGPRDQELDKFAAAVGEDDSP
ncbi:MAG: AbrB/MazE/SpoVT family DNA-binding domain-containing protein [Opitutus sp.]|nr:AbrB/MazE/SpoVT family DNA-binding domain-containing protein [Opitutus sp.]